MERRCPGPSNNNDYCVRQWRCHFSGTTVTMAGTVQERDVSWGDCGGHPDSDGPDGDMLRQTATSNAQSSSPIPINDADICIKWNNALLKHRRFKRSELDDLRRRIVGQYAFARMMQFSTSDFWPRLVSSRPWPLIYWPQNRFILVSNCTSCVNYTRGLFVIKVPCSRIFSKIWSRWRLIAGEGIKRITDLSLRQETHQKMR